MKFKAGDQVTWTSQAHGSTKSKTGKVEQIVPRNTPVKTLTDELDAPGYARDHESYLVRVPGKTSRSKGKLYWPRAAALSPAN